MIFVLYVDILQEKSSMYKKECYVIGNAELKNIIIAIYVYINK